MSDLTDVETDVIGAINVAGSVFSLCGSFLVILCYLKFKNLRSFAFKLVRNMAINDCLLAFCNLLGGEFICCDTIERRFSLLDFLLLEQMVDRVADSVWSKL